jgi:hypothetical protein
MSAVAAGPQNEVVEATASAAAATRAISPKEQKPMENATITAGAGARSEESAAVVQAVPQPAVDEQKLRDEAVQAERLRVAKIREMTLPFRTQLGERFSYELIDSGASSENAGIRILERLAALGKAEPPTDPNQPGNATVTRDAGDTMRESMAAYILYRDNPSSVKLEEGKGREYVGMRLSELARECLEVKGVRTRGMNPDRIALSALTTTDFPAILANVANKTLREGYLAAPRTFTQFCRQVSAVDFKPVNRVQMSDLQALQPLNETGEYHRAPLSDSVQTYALATFGEVVAISVGGGAHMLDNFTVRYADELVVRMDITAQWARDRARGNEMRAPWFGMSPNDVRAIVLFAQSLFHANVTDLAVRLKVQTGPAVWMSPLGSQDEMLRKVA